MTFQKTVVSSDFAFIIARDHMHLGKNNNNITIGPTFSSSNSSKNNSNTIGPTISSSNISNICSLNSSYCGSRNNSRA